MSVRSPAALLGRKCRVAVLLLALGVLLAARPARAGEFTDAAGRHVMLPDQIGRILPAERNAEVLVFVLAPEKLVGLDRVPLAKRPARPLLGWRPRTDPATMAETARRLRPDLIIDAGTVTPGRAAFANRVMQETRIPYILVDDSFARVARSLRGIAAILGTDSRHTRDLFLYAEHTIAELRGRLLILPANNRPRVYYAIGADGLTTALPGSPAGEAIDEAGAINVAGALGRGTEIRVSPAQLAAWDPQIILAEGPRAYDSVRRNPAWRRLSAVRNHKVYLEPTSPFGWIEDPSGVNRLIGLHWLSTLLYPSQQEADLRTSTCEFYDKFYRIKLTNAQVEAMVRPAGAPPPEKLQPVGEAAGGLGAAPSASPPAASAAPGGFSGPPGLMPSIPSGAAPRDTCTVPGAAGPLDMPVTPGLAPSATPPPGVPPPGRRGRPAALLNPPAAVPSAETAGSSSAGLAPSAQPADTIAIDIDKAGNITVDGKAVPAAEVPAALQRAQAQRDRHGKE